MMFLNKYISPSGMRMLWMVIFVLIGLLVFLIRRWYFNVWANSIRIRKKIWYSGGLKMSVNIYNKSKQIVEIDTPVIEFRQPHKSKRRFKIVTPGTTNLFPLGLSPQTSYDFLVEFTRMYDQDPGLRAYKQVIIRIKDPKGATIIKRKVKISFPE